VGCQLGMDTGAHSTRGTWSTPSNTPAAMTHVVSVSSGHDQPKTCSVFHNASVRSCRALTMLPCAITTRPCALAGPSRCFHVPSQGLGWYKSQYQNLPRGVQVIHMPPSGTTVILNSSALRTPSAPPIWFPAKQNGDLIAATDTYMHVP
jgi:hypothetical protein